GLATVQTFLRPTRYASRRVTPPKACPSPAKVAPASASLEQLNRWLGRESAGGPCPTRNSNGGLSYVRKQSRLGLRKRRRPKLTERALVWMQMRGAAGFQVLMMNF